jgi:hypothetical protein
LLAKSLIVNDLANKSDDLPATNKVWGLVVRQAGAEREKFDF